ncbi:MAG: DEAD/DEAH box helicase [Acidimicrobiales bacterium]
MPISFADLGVPADLFAVLSRRGITEPFAIQSATLPDALAGRDVCGQAPTGSGKTLAFGLTIAARVAAARPRHPRGLVLVPTRELAAQIERELAPLLQVRGRKTGSIYGGVGFDRQRRMLSRGVDVVVACPGRLADLIQQGDISLDSVDIAVVDEADRMADMGFLPEVKRLLDQTSPERQTLLFSATLDGDVDVLVRRYQNAPIVHSVEPDDTSSGEVRHLFWRAERSERVRLTAELVASHSPTVVFCRTRRGADRLAKQLEGAGIEAVAIHGSRSQSQRDRALSQFATGKASALVATDVAARGIHVDDVSCVVHFDPPADSKDYVHRSGRTGRAGNPGTVVSLVAGEDARAARMLQKSLGLPDGLRDPDLTAMGEGRPARLVEVREVTRGGSTPPRQAAAGTAAANTTRQNREKRNRSAARAASTASGNTRNGRRGQGQFRAGKAGQPTRRSDRPARSA